MPALIYAEMRRQVFDALQQLQKNGVLPADADFANVTVEQPRDAEHGDFATNAAMVLNKQAGIPPRVFADKLVELLRISCADILQSIEIAGPGFINFRVKPAVMQGQLVEITKVGRNFVRSDVGNGEKVMVEFCSANPTGPIHAGHMRGTVFGDILSRLLERCGYDVHREFYVNDAGNQIRILVKTVHLRYLQLFGKNVEIPDGCYPGEYVVDIAHAVKNRDGDKWLNVTDEEAILLGIRELCVETMLADIKKDLNDLGIAPFHRFFSEWQMQQEGLPDAIMAKLEKQGLVYTGTLPPPKGKPVEDYEPLPLPLFKSTEFGDDVDRPMKNSEGRFTYFGGDVAYHTTKIDRGFSKMVDVFGADHGGTVKRLVAAVEAVSGKKGALTVKLMQMVRFVKDGQPIKFSKRAGNIITLRQILDDVGPDAARFWFTNRKPDTQFDFDLGKAIEQNNDNPIFYVQYGHARMCSIFRQQKEMGIADIAPEKVNVTLLTLPEEMALLQHLSALPMVMERAAVALEPHRLATYVLELAAKFHSWYNACKFLEPDNLPQTHARLLLVAVCRDVMAGVLEDVLGITAPDKM